jgi:hypothetical protein
MSSCGAETLANSLTTSLTADENFALPEVDLTSPEFQLPAGDGDFGNAVRLTNADLTTGVVGGTGTFDALMKSMKAHLAEEYEKGRITGEQFSKVYMGGLESALGNAVQFLLGRDQSYWQAVTAQLNAQAARAAVVTARVQLETAKVQLQATRLEAKKSKAEYALTKMKISSESAAYCIAKYNLEYILPANLKMIQEQAETARAQTSNTRTDGTPIAGSVGKQVELYDQQITSYKRDSEVKVAKLFTDAWITQKTIDEGLLAPPGFTNSSLDGILTKLKTVNNLTP